MYFCYVEALQNCAKHAPGAAVRVVLASPEPEWLTFSVEDNGPEFDSTVPQAGSGQQHVAVPDCCPGRDTHFELGTGPGHDCERPITRRSTRYGAGLEWSPR